VGVLRVALGALIPRLRIVNANDNGSRLAVHPALAAIGGGGRVVGAGQHRFPCRRWPWCGPGLRALVCARKAVVWLCVQSNS